MQGHGQLARRESAAEEKTEKKIRFSANHRSQGITQDRSVPYLEADFLRLGRRLGDANAHVGDPSAAPRRSPSGGGARERCGGSAPSRHTTPHTTPPTAPHTTPPTPHTTPPTAPHTTPAPPAPPHARPYGCGPLQSEAAAPLEVPLRSPFVRALASPAEAVTTVPLAALSAPVPALLVLSVL